MLFELPRRFTRNCFIPFLELITGLHLITKSMHNNVLHFQEVCQNQITSNIGKCSLIYTYQSHKGSRSHHCFEDIFADPYPGFANSHSRKWWRIGLCPGIGSHYHPSQRLNGRSHLQVRPPNSRNGIVWYPKPASSLVSICLGTSTHHVVLMRRLQIMAQQHKKGHGGAMDSDRERAEWDISSSGYKLIIL